MACGCPVDAGLAWFRRRSSTVESSERLAALLARPWCLALQGLGLEDARKDSGHDWGGARCRLWAGLLLLLLLLLLLVGRASASGVGRWRRGKTSAVREGSARGRFWQGDAMRCDAM